MKSISYSRILDHSSQKIVSLLKQTDPEIFASSEFDFETFLHEYKTRNFDIAIIKGNQLMYSNIPKEFLSFNQIESTTTLTTMTDTPIILSENHSLMATIEKTYHHETYRIIALSNYSHAVHMLFTNNAYFFLFLLGMLLFFFMIFLVCRSYSKRMTKKLMLLIIRLGEGADRIEQGNLDLMLEYEQKDEFRPVFDSFNNMQKRLKENILLSIDHEQKQQEMIAQISHDLKTPLTAIKGYVKGLMDGIATTDKGKYII